MLDDLRYGFRLLARRPGFTVAVVLTLALGIGANTAVYSVINAVLLRPAPVEALDRLVMVWETDRASATLREPASVPDFLDFRERARTIEQLTAFQGGEVNLTRDGADPEHVAILRVSRAMFGLLGIPPMAGRVFTAEEDSAGGARVVMISAALAGRLFGNATAALGQSLRLNDVSVEIVGVVPDATDFGVLQILSAASYGRSFADRGEASRVDLWLPLRPDPQALPRETHPIFQLAKLAPSASRDAAQAELAAIAADLERTYPVNRNRGINVELMSDVVFGPLRPMLALLLAAVVAVLLIACVNVANLLLARGATRTPEIAVRTAVGAGLSRLFRQFLAESVAFTIVAAVAGLAAGFIGLRALLSLAPGDIPRLGFATLDGTVLGGALIVAAAVGVTFGVLPTLQARRLNLSAALKDAGSRSTGDRGRLRVRRALVIAELTLAVMLLAGAGLLVRSFWNLRHVDTGFRPEGVLKAEYLLPPSRYPANRAVFPNYAEQHAFSSALLERVAALPGVTSAAIAGNHPLDRGFTNSFRVSGREAEGSDWPEISIRRTSPGYFRTVGLPLISGRLLEDSDSTSSPAVAVINEATATRFFPNSNPIGAEIRFWGIPRRIVGVVGNEKFQGLSGPAPIAIYAPLAQLPDNVGVLLVKTNGDPSLLVAPVRRAFREQDAQLAVFGIEPLEDTLLRTVSERRFAMLLVAAFSAIAVLLAGIGVYGVLSYDVALRRREIGVRLALGARQLTILQMIVGQALILIAIAVGLGVTGALGLSRLLEALLFGISARDPLTIAAVALLLGAVGLIAAALPAWRASRVAPASALRDS